MTGPLHPIVRSLAGLLAVVTALAVALQALMFVQRSHPVLLLGAAGALAATVILFRTHRVGARLNRTDVALLLIGLAAPVVAVPVFIKAGEYTIEDAFRVYMKSDLRNLETAQDAYLAAHGTFAEKLSDLGESFRESEGISISLAASGRTFRASARHERITATCAIFVGTTPIAPATKERQPACTPKP